MKIPNSARAIVELRKLCQYCLNPNHDEGKHKARLFEALLGMTANDAEDLRNILLQAVTSHDDARLGRLDEFGQPYLLDFLIEWKNKKAIIRSGWIIEHNSGIPKLTTCYPLYIER